MQRKYLFYIKFNNYFFFLIEREIGYKIYILLFRNTFQKQLLHWSWLVIRPEKGWDSTETDGMLVDGIEHKDFHDLKMSLQSLLLMVFRDNNSEDLARIIPGLREFVNMLDIDEVEVIIWLLQFLSKPFEVSESFSADAISLHEALLRLSWSPTLFISTSVIGLGGNASDRQPF